MFSNQLKTLCYEIQSKLKAHKDLIDSFKSINDIQVNDCKEDPIITLNIGGKEFLVPKSTLFKIENTLFTSYFHLNKDSKEARIFFDRNGEYFGDIIDYFNDNSLPLQYYSTERLSILQSDAQYYHIQPLMKYINYYLTPLKLIAIMTPSTVYDGEIDLNASLTSKESNMGCICETYQYEIIFKLNIECELDSIQIKGYSGIIRAWDINCGNNSQVYTSTDNIYWIHVGQLPSDLSTIQTVHLLKSKAKYIKFSHHSYIGIGYLKLVKC